MAKNLRVATVKIKGVDQFLKNMRNLGDKAYVGAERALTNEANAILKDSQDFYVPVDKEDLKKSGKVHDPERKGTEVEVMITYGEGLDRDYAVAVHEIHSEHDPPSWVGKDINWTKPGTGPKYLELPFLAAQKGIEKRLANRLKGVLTGGWSPNKM